MIDGIIGLGLTFVFGVICGALVIGVYLSGRLLEDVEFAEDLLRRWDARCAQCGRPPFIVTKKDDSAGSPPATVG